MIVSSCAVNAEQDVGHGVYNSKKQHINTNDYQIFDCEDDLLIQAEDSETRGTGERGGNPKTINRYFYVRLDAKDLEKIFAAAVKAKLIVPPGLRSLLEAKQLIEQTISEWQG